MIVAGYPHLEVVDQSKAQVVAGEPVETKLNKQFQNFYIEGETTAK